jgi:hypothetical protein
MAIVIVKGKLTKKDFGRAREDYRGYIKITIDIVRGLAVLGGEYHADAEELLLREGSRQEDIWGGGVNLETGEFEVNAIINIRPKVNSSSEILDPGIREKFLILARGVLKGYVG